MRSGLLLLRPISLACDHLLPAASHPLTSVQVQISSTSRDTSHIVVGPTLMTSFYTAYFFKHATSKYSHIKRYWRLEPLNFGREWSQLRL